MSVCTYLYNTSLKCPECYVTTSVHVHVYTGARPQVTALLLKLQELAENEQTLKVKMAELDEINMAIEQTRSKAQKYIKLYTKHV